MREGHVPHVRGRCACTAEPGADRRQGRTTRPLQVDDPAPGPTTPIDGSEEIAIAAAETGAAMATENESQELDQALVARVQRAADDGSTPADHGHRVRRRRHNRAYTG